MTKIRLKAFSNRIKEYLNTPDSYDEKRFDSSLFTVIKTKRQAEPLSAGPLVEYKDLHGLCFGAHIELVMILLAQSFNGLADETTIDQFSRAMAGAMQTFSEPIAVGGCGSFPDPIFLLHGINRVTLSAAVKRFVSNGRIIHETIALKDKLIAKYGEAICLGYNLKMFLEEGVTEDCFGLCCYITKSDEPEPHGTTKSYIAKVSFFLDSSHKEIYVITVQGQRVLRNDKNRSRDYARLAAKMGMDPRTFVLKKVCELGRAEGFKKIRVVRSNHHPMFLENHAGFMAKYEPVVLNAGIVEENGCYLQGAL